MGRRLERLGVVLGAAIAAAGCTRVVGDFHLVSREAGSGGSAGSTASGGSAGSTASGGSAGSTASGGSGGSSGSGGSAGVGGTTATGGSAGTAGCGSGSGGAPGTLTTLASGENYPEAIALGGGDVYWVDRAGDTIDKVSESGKSLATVIVPGTLANTPQGICPNLPSSMYWTDFNGLNEWSFANSTSTLRVNGSGKGTFAAVATDGKDVYFADSEATTSTIEYIAVDTTGTPVGTISVGGTGGFTIESLLLDSSDVYFTVSNPAGKSYLDRLPLEWPTTAAVTTLSTQSYPGGGLAEIASAPATIVWAAGDGLWQSAGTTQSFEDYSGQSLRPQGVVAYGGWVYWTLVARKPADLSKNIGKVMARPLGQGACADRVIATGQPNPVAIAVDASGVYWVNAKASGNVMKAPLP